LSQQFYIFCISYNTVKIHKESKSIVLTIQKRRDIKYDMNRWQISICRCLLCTEKETPRFCH